MLNCPQEILDSIVDFSATHCDWKRELQQCCLVSRSWVAPTQKHLFAHIEILKERDHRSWTNTFPGPNNPLAYYTRTLEVEAAFGAGETSWINAFSRVECLVLHFGGHSNRGPGDCATSFRILAPSLKALHVRPWIKIPPSRVFGLIRSLPLLEDLSVSDRDLVDEDGPPTGPDPFPPPALTGSLKISLYSAKGWFRQLLDLRGGLHFTKLTLILPGQEEDLLLAEQLMEACRYTLECLEISFPDNREASKIKLSELEKLQDITIKCGPSLDWIAETLESIKSSHLRKNLIHPTPFFFRYLYNLNTKHAVETVRDIWSRLDRVLMSFSKSHSIRPEFFSPRHVDEMALIKGILKSLMPESSGRGVIDLNFIADT